MKKITKLLFIILLLFLVGCKEKEVEPEIEETKYLVTIDNKAYQVKEGTNLEILLKSLYGDNLYLELDDYEFKGYFYDEEYLVEITDFDISIDKDIKIYTKYVHYFIELNNVIKYGAKKDVELSGDVIIISPSYYYGIKYFDLSKYKKFVVTFDLEINNYVVINEDESRLPYDGFLILIDNDSEKFDEYVDLFAPGRVIYLNSYNIDRSSMMFFEKKEVEATEFEMTGLSSKYVSVYDVYANKTLFSKNGDSMAYPASVTKIITALTALKYCPLDYVHTVGGELSLTFEGPSPSLAGLARGQVWTLWQLLFGLMLPSGNDAAYAIGALTIDCIEPNNSYTPKEKLTKFATLMNETAKYVSATGSHFTVPDGNNYYNSDGSWDIRSVHHYVTANDMVRFALLGFNCAALAFVVSTHSISFNIESGQHFSFTNGNPLINPNGGYYYKGAIGMKTGYTTPAGLCLVSGVFKNGRFIIIACLYAPNSDTRNRETIKLYNKVFN